MHFRVSFKGSQLVSKAPSHREVRKRKLEEEGGSECEMLKYSVHICSENNFPTAAGLASSAAGYACLVFALSRSEILTFSQPI